MARMRIKNFGPIKAGLSENDGWIEFKRLTVFIGNQGSGKSTIAKLFATFSWIEKALVRGDHDKKWFERKNRLRNQFLKYHRLEGYISNDSRDATKIDYEGEAFAINYEHGLLTINEVSGQKYLLPQIMYVPAERNFISYVDNPKDLRLSSDSLKEFLAEFDNAKNSMRGAISLPISEAELEYDKLNDVLKIKDAGYKLKLTDASSGFQSSIPLYLVTKFLAEGVGGKDVATDQPMSVNETERFKNWIGLIAELDVLTEEQKRAALSRLASRFNKSAFLNIVEEPEQNLFPSSQWEMLKSLIKFNNIRDSNHLVVTTHSPYVINFLSICVKAALLKEKILQQKNAALELKLEELIPSTALVNAQDLAIYQSDEKSGVVMRLGTSHGIPSDRNFLNNFLHKGNDIFDELLVIEEELQA